MEYRIPEVNMEKLREKLAKIERKCKKYGCEFSFTEKSTEYETVKDAETGVEKTIAFVVVDVSGKSVINGWEFIAKIDHTEKGNILQGYSDVEIPARFYKTPCFCEHCKTARRRNNTFIVRKSETGEFKQVGKSCLLDYTHGLSAENVADYMSYFREIEDARELPEFKNVPRYIDRDEFMIFTAETIRCFGYEKGKTGWTSIECRDAFYGNYPQYFSKQYKMFLREMEKMHFDIKREDSKKLVADALKWIENQDESNNYMHNLKTACALDYVKPEHYNLLASLFPTFNRDLEYQKKKAEEKKAEKSSEYVGKIKDRITVEIVNCKAVTSYYTDFGITTIYKMIDKNGNVFIWKTGKAIDLESFTITGTVKEHKEFRDVKQTELTRCRVVEHAGKSVERESVAPVRNAWDDFCESYNSWVNGE